MVRNQAAALAVALGAAVALAWLTLSRLAWEHAEARVGADLQHLTGLLDQRFGEVQRLGEGVAGLWRDGALPLEDGPEMWRRLHPLVVPQETLITGLNLVRADGAAFGMSSIGRHWAGRTLAERSGRWASGPILGDPENQVRHQVGLRSQARDFRTREWYRQGAASTSPLWTSPYAFVGYWEGHAGLSYVVPVRREGALVGVLSFDLLLENLTRSLDDVRPTPGAVLLALDREGRLLSSPPGQSALLQPLSAVLGRAVDLGQTSGATFRFPWRGAPTLGRLRPYRHTSGLEWTLFLAIPEREVAGEPRQRTLLMAGLGTLLLGLFTWQWRQLARRVGHPLQRLAEEAQALGRGEPPAPVVSGIQELEGLGAALQEAHQALAERERLQEQLRQSQKLETVGTLAGGIAHDVNNQLTAILGQLELGMERVEEDHPVRQSLLRAAEAAHRCAETTRALLAFSRPSPPELAPVDLNDTVRESLLLLGRVTKGSVSLSATLEEGLPGVLGDRVQLEQILVNLVLNARDALPAGGTLDVGTRREPEGGVVLWVRDNGIGMTPEVQARIFEPFFTTKAVGTGTGLGLTMVKSLVEAHGGRIEVASTWGAGTTVSIHLTPVEEEGVRGPTPVPSNRAGELRGMRVLVAEDEPLIRSSLVEWLEEKGAAVVAAADGEAAWTEFQAGLFDAVVSDHLMPRCTGLELLGRIREVDPEIPVILVSGRGLEGFEHTDAHVVLLPKPYRLTRLASVLEDHWRRT